MKRALSAVMLVVLAGCAGPPTPSPPQITTYAEFRSHYASAAAIDPSVTEAQAHAFLRGWVVWLDTHLPEACYAAVHRDLRTFYSALEAQSSFIFTNDTLVAQYLPASTHDDLVFADATCK